MAFKASNKATGDFVEQEPLETGTYSARIVQIIDLGLQAQPDFQGQSKKPAQELMIGYELVDEFMKNKDGEEDESKPRWVSETFPLRNLSSDLAKSTKRYKALDPSLSYDGDFSQLLGMPCMVSIVTQKGKNGKIYNNVANIAAMRSKDAMKCPELKNEARLFTPDDPDMEIFNKLPEWIQNKIKANLNFKGSPLEKELGGSTKVATPEPSVQEESEDAPF